MEFKKALKNGEFVITSDVVPPKGTELTKKLASLSTLKGYVHGVNATDMPAGNLRLGALAMSIKIKELGLDPILQITCRDRNRLSLQSELLSADVLGINNVLALTGDNLEKSDHPDAKAVFDINSVELIKATRGLENGLDFAGNKLNGTPSFCLGAALDPGSESITEEIEKAFAKQEAGAEFYQTQPIFDIDFFAKFLDRLKGLKGPILGGVFLITSAKMARFFNENVPGVTIPESVITELEGPDPLKASIEITARLIRDLRSLCAGVHIMTVSDHYPKIVEIIEKSVM